MKVHHHFLYIYGLVIMNILTASESLQIRPIQLHEASIVKRMIIDCAYELWNPPYSKKRMEEKFMTAHEFADLDTIEETYLQNNGIFLVLAADNVPVGSGAIKKMDSDTCELKRMWFYNEYRGKGWGFKMIQHLLAFAKSKQYKKVLLDVYKPEFQTAAVQLYKKVGFIEIARYNNSFAQLFMEKNL